MVSIPSLAFMEKGGGEINGHSKSYSFGRCQNIHIVMKDSHIGRDDTLIVTADLTELPN